MASAALLDDARREGWSDEQIVSRVLAGEIALYEVLMRRYNRLLYRVARAILRDDAEAEDVMQDAYVRAYQHPSSFQGRAKFQTWLTRIALHEAWARHRKHSRFQIVDNLDEATGEDMNSAISVGRTPEQQAYDRELGSVLEKAVLTLPQDHRVVFILREVGRHEH
jgi:RNA polymerase sigma-70 factor, ECF subfamily